MRNLSPHKKFWLTVCCVLMLTDGVLAAGLRSIRRQYYRKEYEGAKARLIEEMRRFGGKDRVEGKLLLAALETDVHKAGELYQEVVSSGRLKESFSARLELAKIYYAEDEYERAIQILMQVPSDVRSSERSEAIYFRGLAWKQLGEMERARAEFAGIDRGEYLYWSYIALAELDMQSGNITGAIEKFETIAGSHSNPVAGFKLGECYEIMGGTEKALDVYRNLARLYPRSLEAPKAREKIQMINRSLRYQSKRSDLEGGEEGELSVNRTVSDQTEETLYTLQFGAFSENENAQAFAAELGENIQGLRIETIESKGKIWHRVRIGIYSSREKAEAEALRLMEISGYSSKVLPLD
ncbi:MAG: SPOR domain-containing protein [Candidatus Krumholzibacteriota bacterium]|nr:SPOR domain-containing protein [Candidatus Krumholzibacteriota bacterium]